jgi:hypothetical protein
MKFSSGQGWEFGHGARRRTDRKLGSQAREQALP